MLTTISSAPELLRLGTVRELLRSPGPCISMFLPPYRPGEPTGSIAALIKSNVKSIAHRLSERKFPDADMDMLLEPLERLGAGSAFEGGTHWSQAIFRSPSVFELFHLAQPVKASLEVSGCFSIRPLALELATPGMFHILALSKTKVALIRCSGLHAEVVRLPKGVPETLADALDFEPPDHDLENRSAIGSSTGAMRNIRFGTGSGRETEHAHLGDYYKMVDRGLQESFRDPETLLILAGVEEDVAIYRAVSTYRNLVKSDIGGSPINALQLNEMLQQGYSILREEGLERKAAELAAARERIAPNRFSMDPDKILHAAFDGRLSQLYLCESAERFGVFERGNYRSWGKEDLLNLAAVQTLIHHGEVWTLPASMMPERSIAAGLMRY